MIPPSVRSHALLQQIVTVLPSQDAKDDIDDAATTSTRTDDDPVNLAMKATLDSDMSDHDMDDEEEDQILYPKQVMSTPMKQVNFIPVLP